MNDRTERQAPRGLPIQALHVDVIAGPDMGEALEGTEETVTVGSADGNALTVTDRTVSRFHVELASSPEGIVIRDLGSTNGTFVGALRLSQGVVPPGTEIRVGETVLRVRDGAALEAPLSGEAIGGLRGHSAAMRRLMARLSKLAESDVSVLLTGESGTGKELAARALHELGRRASEPFVVVDCAGPRSDTRRERAVRS